MNFWVFLVLFHSSFLQFWGILKTNIPLALVGAVHLVGYLLSRWVVQNTIKLIQNKCKVLFQLLNFSVNFNLCLYFFSFNFGFD